MDMHMPWEYLLLGILRNYGGTAGLQAIYQRIEDDQIECIRDGVEVIDPALFGIDGRWGDRPDYQHTVRSYLHDMKERGLVSWAGRGTYRISDAGLARLSWLETQY